MQHLESKIWLARISMFVIAFLYIAISVVSELRNPSEDMLRNIGIGIAIGGIFAALGFLSKESPFTGILIALILYFLLMILEIATSEFNIFRGVVFRLAAVIILLRGLLVAKDFERMLKERNQNF